MSPAEIAVLLGGLAVIGFGFWLDSHQFMGRIMEAIAIRTKQKENQMRSRVMYSSNGEDWWRTEWVPKCEEKIFLANGQCQGTADHKGIHWAFSLDGSLGYDHNDNDPGEDDGCGSIPPGHKTYRSPLEMQPLHHSNFRTCVPVTDPEIIKRLENDDAPEQFASINKPMSKDDPFYEEAQRRMDEYKAKHPEDSDD